MSQPFSSKAKHFLYVAKATGFCLGIAPAAGTRLSVVMGGVELCKPGYVNTREGFPYLCIECVASGEGRLLLEGKKYRLSSGTVFSYGPHIPHDIRTTGRGRMTKYFVTFTGTVAESLLRSHGMSPGTVLTARNMQRIVACYEHLIANGCDDGAHCGRICALSLETLLFVLADNTIPYGFAADKALETFQVARNLVDEHFLTLHDLRGTAAMSRLDPSYLCRLFRRFAKTTPYRYLLTVKMRHAAEIMRTERILVKDLAARLGYSNPYQFSRTFKKVHGLSPEHYALLANRMC